MPKSSRPGRLAEKVGYKRPPKHSQFKPGQSGNSKGRPKGSRSIGTIFRKIAELKYAVTENGRTRKYTALEIALRRLANDAMRGDQNAIKLWLVLQDRYSDSGEVSLSLDELQTEDKEILARYLPTGRRTTKSRSKRGK